MKKEYKLYSKFNYVPIDRAMLFKTNNVVTCNKTLNFPMYAKTLPIFAEKNEGSFRTALQKLLSALAKNIFIIQFVSTVRYFKNPELTTSLS